MSHRILDDARAEALFVSSLQCSERPTPDRVRVAIMQAVRRYGTRGCAARVAYEFGEHPETALPRMTWAQSQVRTASPRGGRGAGLAAGGLFDSAQRV